MIDPNESKRQRKIDHWVEFACAAPLADQSSTWKPHECADWADDMMKELDIRIKAGIL